VVTKPVVALFDVDETLVHTGGSGARSWNAAFEKLYGFAADITQHTSAGETDPQVTRETFRGVLGRDPRAEELDNIYAQDLCTWPTTSGPPSSTRSSPAPNRPSLASPRRE
jgi:phosphoglycolate phosphatase-like HAD superfamily hydrolase